MNRFLLIMLGLALAFTGLQEANAQRRPARPNNQNVSQNRDGLPKVDFQIGQITPLGQGLAIPVKNGGFERSPGTTVNVAVYELLGRRLLMVKSFNVSAMAPGQSNRVIIVPPNQGQRILVRAMVDPGNKVAETNERNNQVASQH